MTKKHYIAMAKMVTELDLSFADRQHVALKLANVFEQDNSRFDRATFLKACRVN